VSGHKPFRMPEICGYKWTTVEFGEFEHACLRSPHINENCHVCTCSVYKTPHVFHDEHTGTTRDTHNAFVSGYLLRCHDLMRDIQESSDFVELRRKNIATIRSARRSFL